MVVNRPFSPSSIHFFCKEHMRPKATVPCSLAQIQDSVCDQVPPVQYNTVIQHPYHPGAGMSSESFVSAAGIEP